MRDPYLGLLIYAEYVDRVTGPDEGLMVYVGDGKWFPVGGQVPISETRVTEVTTE